jgi:hypothetical protein
MNHGSSHDRSRCPAAVSAIGLFLPMLLLCLVTAAPVFAQQRLNGEDLDILVDSRWAGTGSGGYFPVRIRARNNAKHRTVTFQFEGGNVSPVTRTIELQSGATTELTVLVPMFGSVEYSRPQLEVIVDGRRSTRLRAVLEFPGQAAPWPEPALLVISDDRVDFDEYDKAVHAFFENQPQASSSSGYLLGGVSTESDRQWIPPTLLPRTWLAYTGLDLVSVPLSTLESMEAEARDAILGWVETGGTLLVTEVGRPASESTELASVLGLAQRAAAGDRWQVPTEASRAGSLADPTASTSPESAAPSVAGAAPGVAPPAPAPVVATRASSSWPEGGEVFSYRRIQRGKVVAFVGEPMPGGDADWVWFFRELSESRVGSRWLEWEGRHGMSTRGGLDDFLGFTVPGVDSVPVAAFLILITIFTVVIGPVNFVYLRRRGQLYLLVVTVPVIAMVTSAAMLGYAAFSHGFGIKSHTRSITFLDQGNESAVTMARVALFAGMAPSTLEFSRDTAVYPAWPHGSGFGSGTADWTDRQVLGNGWIKTRTRAQMQTVRRFPLRGRISVGSPDDQGQVTVDNGLEWDLRYLYVCDQAGRRYLAQDISAGRSVKLDELPLSDASSQTPLTNAVSEHYLVSANSERRLSGQGNGRGGRTIEARFSLLEFHLSAFRQTSGLDQLPRRSYMAILAQDPGIERGCSTTDSGSLHVLVGQY